MLTRLTSTHYQFSYCFYNYQYLICFIDVVDATNFYDTTCFVLFFGQI